MSLEELRKAILSAKSKAKEKPKTKAPKPKTSTVKPKVSTVNSTVKLLLEEIKSLRNEIQELKALIAQSSKVPEDPETAVLQTILENEPKGLRAVEILRLSRLSKEEAKASINSLKKKLLIFKDENSRYHLNPRNPRLSNILNVSQEFLKELDQRHKRFSAYSRI